MQNDRTELFEAMPIPKAVATLAIPTVMSSLVMVLYNLADTYFVGMINDPIQNAAVTLVAPVMLAFNAVTNLFGVGTSSMMSRALGRKDYETVYKSSVFGFYCSLFAGALFALLCTVCKMPLLHLLGAATDTLEATAAYMLWTVNCGAIPAILNVVMAYLVRSEGASLHASIGTMSGCFLNIILDPIFILGLHMGAAGAGLATFLSNCAACLYFLILLRVKRGNTFVCVDIRKFSLDKNIVLGIFTVGIPASIQNLLNVTGMTILNNFTAAFGANAVAAMGIAQKLNMIPLQIAVGVCQGIMPLVSYTYAGGNGKRMKKAIMFTGKLAVGMMAVATVGFYLCAGSLIQLFINNGEVIAYGTRFLRGFCIGLIFLCLDFLGVCVFQAVGMGKEALAFAILRKIVLEIPALFILNALFPLYGLAYSQFVAEIFLGMASVMILRKLFKKTEQRKEYRSEAAAKQQ